MAYPGLMKDAMTKATDNAKSVGVMLERERIIPLAEKRYPLSVHEVADFLHVSRKSILRAIQRGDLHTTRVGGVYRIWQENLEAWILSD
jgi:excisionase family DNA binding protein